jgi:adenosylcobinamide-GDP ribazoletransferase
LTERDTWRPRPGDLLAALGLLTRLPLPSGGRHRGAEAAWAWPLAGAAVGLIGAAVGMAALWAGLVPVLAAVLVIAAQVLATGALHEDGLADTADGLWGGRDRARRLEIMRDSRIGSYGVMALLLVTLARWMALSLLIAMTDWGAIVAAAAMSRAPMAAIMAALPNARDDGLSKGMGRPSGGAVLLAFAIAAAIGAVLIGPAALSGGMAALAICGALALAARARIGGQTGDILGASQQLAELALLLAAASLLRA